MRTSLLPLGATSMSGFTLPLFYSTWADHYLTDISWLRSDTFSWQSGALYVAAYEELETEYNATTETTTDIDTGIVYKVSAKGYKMVAPDQEEKIMSLFTSTGVAWYYIVDTVNKRFKLPRVKTPSLYGKYIDSVAEIQDAPDGYLYFYMGNYKQPAINQTAGVTTEVLNEKADLDFGNCPYVPLSDNKITNCLIENPQLVNLELKDKIITLKAGSTVIIPYGTSAPTMSVGDTLNNGVISDISWDGSKLFYYVKISADTYSQSGWSSEKKQYMIFGVFTGDGGLNRQFPELISSGDDYPDVSGTSGRIHYNTTENKISYHDGTSWLDTYYPLPCAIATSESSGTPSWISIDQVFQSIGYIGSTVWVGKGVKGLAPNGRNEDGSLNNTIISPSHIFTLTETNTGSGYKAVCWNNFISNSTYNEYFEDTNYIIHQINESVQMGFVFAEYDRNSGVISNFVPKTTFHAVDYNDFKQVNVLTNKSEILEQIHNRIFTGRDLTQIFANEISGYSDEWAWIKARIQAGDYDGIYVGDYIPVTISAGTVGGQTINAQTLQCQIAGIDSYRYCADAEIGHHIDFISREVIDTAMTWNPTDNNNGTSVQSNPWLASKAYAWLNGVNNYTTSAYNSVAHGADCSSGGILQLLPTKLRNLIIEKRQLLDSRYDSTKLLSYSTSWVWGNMGKLWLPSEIEAYGFQVRSNLGYASGYWNPEANIAVSYPIYANSGMNRVKRASTGGRSSWWLSSVAAHDTTSVCFCSIGGGAYSTTATHSGIRCPLCFRLA